MFQTNYTQGSNPPEFSYVSMNPPTLFSIYETLKDKGTCCSISSAETKEQLVRNFKAADLAEVQSVNITTRELSLAKDGKAFGAIWNRTNSNLKIEFLNQETDPPVTTLTIGKHGVVLWDMEQLKPVLIDSFRNDYVTMIVVPNPEMLELAKAAYASKTSSEPPYHGFSRYSSE